MKKFAVVLAGCGVYDGAEIQEATLTLLAIARMGGSYEIFAPDMPQHHVVNHLTGEETGETRNVLVESARIARGQIKDLAEYDPSLFDALVFPGGFGVAKNLSSWAFKGKDASVNPQVEKAIISSVEAGKVIGALCISPVVMARVLKGTRVTIGSDESTSEAIESWGATHVPTSHGEIVIDDKYRLVTTPCYMLDSTIDQVDDGVKALIKAMIGLM